MRVGMLKGINFNSV